MTASEAKRRFGRQPTRLLVVSPVRLYRDGLVQVFGSDERFEVVATAADAGEALERARAASVDVVLLDTAIANGAPTVAALVAEQPAVRVVALAVAEHEDEVIALAEAGVAGYVTLEASLEELVEVVRTVARGDSLCSPWLAGALLRRVRALAATTGRDKPTWRLTAREREIAELIDHGLSNKEIAARLYIELSTVKNHVHNILEKLDVTRRAEAAALLRDARA